MCFGKIQHRYPEELEPYYNEYGSISDPPHPEVYIAEGVHEHIDNPFLDEEDLQHCILAFIYENGNGLHIVYTRFEAELICSFCENCQTVHID